MVNRLFAHLAHVELLTPKLKESTWFFEELLSMAVVRREPGSTYLRAWGEFYVPFSLKLTESEKAGLGHVAWRTESPEDLQSVAGIARESKLDIGWVEGEYGHGKVFRFRSPEGHVNEAFWEMDHFVAPAGMKSKVASRAMKMPNGAIPVSWLDHCTIFASDVKPVRECYQLFDFKYNEGVYVGSTGTEVSAFMTVNVKNHDLGIIRDRTRARGRLNHIAYHVDNFGMWAGAGDVLVENGIFVEMGPLKHGATDSYGTYVIEPGGNRVELFNGGYINAMPKLDWQPVRTDIEKAGKYWITWGLGLMVETWQTYGTPVVPVAEEVKQEVAKQVRRQDPYSADLAGVLAAAELADSA